MTKANNYYSIAGGYDVCPMRVGLVIRNPEGREVYVQPGFAEEVMRLNLSSLDEIDESKRGIIADMLLSEYFA